MADTTTIVQSKIILQLATESPVFLEMARLIPSTLPRRSKNTSSGVASSTIYMVLPSKSTNSE